jgi:hypothetical protein
MHQLWDPAHQNRLEESLDPAFRVDSVLTMFREFEVDPGSRRCRSGGSMN